MSTSIVRVLKNVWNSGIKRSLRQIAMMDDTKSGTLVGTDDYGNKFYETQDAAEIHLRSRWVEYKNFWGKEMSEVEPGWHYWLAYGTDTPPSKLKKEDVAVRYDLHQVHQVNLTHTKGAYVPYNTAKSKLHSWEPKVSARG